MLDKTLEEIRNAEEKAEAILKGAEKKAELLVSKAKDDALKYTNNKKNEEINIKEAIFKRVRKELDCKKKNIIEEYERKASKLEVTAKKNEKKAMEKVLTLFKECLNKQH